MLERPIGGALNEPLMYEEVADVCSGRKLGVSGFSIDYEHVRYAGPPFWNFFSDLPTVLRRLSVSKSMNSALI